MAAPWPPSKPWNWVARLLLKHRAGGLSGTRVDYVTGMVLQAGPGRRPARPAGRSVSPARGTSRGDAVPVRVEG